MKTFEELNKKLLSQSFSVGIVGLGYVGIPLALAYLRENIVVRGVDIDEEKIETLLAGGCYIDTVDKETVRSAIDAQQFIVSTSFSLLAEADVVCICVPTPVNKKDDPDLQFVISAAESVAKYLKKGQLIILESSTYPGTTDGIIAPILTKSNLVEGEDIFIGYSPEREDPGNLRYTTSSIPKIVGGNDEHTKALLKNFYEVALTSVVTMKNRKTAEATKLVENTFRSINIAFVNELKLLFDELGIDIWEVIEGASSKPFGYMPFFPGPGVGGHCIPVDNKYLLSCAAKFNLPMNIITSARDTNEKMPQYVVKKTVEILHKHYQNETSTSIIVLGVAYKANISDIRESPVIEIIKLLKSIGFNISYHDPFVPQILLNDQKFSNVKLESIELTKDLIKDSRTILIGTNHSCLPYQLLADYAAIIIDTRNSMHSFEVQGELYKV